MAKHLSSIPNIIPIIASPSLTTYKVSMNIFVKTYFCIPLSHIRDTFVLYEHACIRSQNTWKSFYNINTCHFFSRRAISLMNFLLYYFSRKTINIKMGNLSNAFKQMVLKRIFDLKRLRGLISQQSACLQCEIQCATKKVATPFFRK